MNKEKYYKFDKRLYGTLNFNVSPKCGKTYYEINKSWKELKQRIKQILDSPNSCKEIKILEIKSILEDYEQRYLIRRITNEK